MIDLIQNKLTAYGATNVLEEEHAIKEILQDIALYGLWRADFFEVAAFQGGTSVNLPHLKAALFQWGPWKNHELNLDIAWLKQELIKKAAHIDFQSAAADVQRFLKLPEQHSLSLWSEKFFIYKIEKL